MLIDTSEKSEKIHKYSSGHREHILSYMYHAILTEAGNKNYFLKLKKQFFQFFDRNHQFFIPFQGS